MRINRAPPVLVLGSWLLLTLAGPAAAQWISFPPAPEKPGVEFGEHVAGRAAYPVRGFLSVPIEPGRHPAVVILPSCAGRKLYHQSWAQALSERGFAALVVDDYFMYDRDRTCGITDPAAMRDVLQLRLLHALGAAHYLSERADVDRNRIAVMGWDDAPISVLLGHFQGLEAEQIMFQAAVTITPTSCLEQGHTLSRPWLVLRPESDASGPDRSCEASESTPMFEVRIYEGTRPGFDDPQAGSNIASTTGASAATTRRYNRLAHVRAIEDVVEFLNRRVPATESAAAHPYATVPLIANPEVGTWAVDPREPGPDLPPQGGSTFDGVFSRLTSTGAVYDVPFPFERLLQRLEHAAGAQSMSRSPLDATLIPLGRSLQREAAAPDYFQSPRIVVSVTGEPESGTGALGIRLKNRLFLGYQPRSQVVEVISYNEAANRFEFQLVNNYGAGREISVRYAPRALCTSCHQNAGPMFSEASWDETTANARVVSSLNGLGGQFLGVRVSEGDRTVSSIDASTDEANLLPVYQRLWAEGCQSTDRKETARCRAGALQAMIQYWLSNSAGFDRTSALYANGYLPLQRGNWNKRWPDGLLIPNPNLPDRSPLMSPSPSAVSAALDPLRQRSPLARWEASSKRDLERLIRGLSHQLPDRHMKALDRYLRGTPGSAPARSLTTTCSAVRRGGAGRFQQLEFDCGNRSETGAGFYMEALVQVTPDGNVEGEAGWVEIDGALYARRTLTGQMVSAPGPGVVLRLSGYDGLAIRAPDGNTVLGLTLAWNKQAFDNASRFPVTGVLSVAADFEPVRAVMESLAAKASDPSPLLFERFDGSRLVHWLLTEIGLPPSEPCCDSKPMPKPQLDGQTHSTDAALSLALEHRGPVQTFRRYCGACHSGDTAFPPGFLHGEGEALLKSVSHCAERILYRLSMWNLGTEDQAVPPMPPVQGLSVAGTSAEDWRESDNLSRLIAYTRELLVKEGRDPVAVLKSSYPSTRACISDADKQRIAGSN